MEEYNYKPQGVCSTNIKLIINGEYLEELQVTGGCNGNLKGISSLVKGMELKEIQKKLKGIKCGFKNTSCPDQIAIAIEEYLGELVK